MCLPRLQASFCEGGQVLLHYPRGPNVITEALKSTGRRHKSEGDVTMGEWPRRCNVTCRWRAGGSNQRIWWPLAAGNGKETDSPVESPEKNAAALPVRPVWDFYRTVR